LARSSLYIQVQGVEKSTVTEKGDSEHRIMSAEVEMRHQYGVVGGLRLHWAEMGETTNTAPIVLLHGINDSHLSWKLVAPLLAVHRRVLIPDLPGCGLSDRPDASYAIAWHARVIADWLAHLALESADFVGHSFGGGVAQMLLLECPARIRRLALIAPGGFGRDVGGWVRLVGIMPGFVEAFGQPFMALGTRLALRGSPFSEQEVTNMSAMNTTCGTARAFARTSRDVVGWRGQKQSFLQRAHEIAVLPPIAVYWGDRDALIPIGQGAAFAQAMQGVSFQTFPGCGHYLHHEQPTAFASALSKFLDLPRAERACVKAVLPRLAPTSFVEAGAPPFYGI
jgi:pimeloyl-ACP methyl ester carboxylesterase